MNYNEQRSLINYNNTHSSLFPKAKKQMKTEIN